MDINRNNLLFLAASSIILAAGALSARNLKRRTGKRRSVWTKPWIARRQEGGGVLNLVERELRLEDPASYRNFLRMTSDNFDEILSYVGSRIKKNDTVMREAIPASTRLALTLRFLATGESFQSLMYSTRIHQSTISCIVPEVCATIYDELKKRGFVKTPQTEEEWKSIAAKFYELWNYPLCLGAIDGKHVVFRPPRSAGSSFYNYKKTHSLVLMAVVDAQYKFLYVDAGANGRISDGGVFRRSSLFRAMQENSLNIPPCANLPGTNIRVPYHFIADDAFSLQVHLMKPYPHRGLSREKQNFNYRLSRARRVVENAFGILCNRFRIFLSPINLAPEKVEILILASVALHNFLAERNPRLYLETNGLEPVRFEDIAPDGVHNSATAAKNIRDSLCQYFNNNQLN